MKIVSLLPSATEVVYALGLGGYLCAVTSDCDHPPEVKDKPVVSLTSLPLGGAETAEEIDQLVRESVSEDQPIYRLDRKLIQRLQPELIIAQDLCRVCAVPSGRVTEALDVIGCHAEVISLDPHTLDEVIAGIEEIGRAVRAPKQAAGLATKLRQRVHDVQSKVRDLERPRTLVLEWANPPFVGGHWIPEMIQFAGGEDVLGIQGAPSREVSWRELAEAAPDVIVFAPCGYGLDEAVKQTRDLHLVEEFAASPAVTQGAVFAVDSSSYFSRPGPRIVDGLELLAWILHPDAFPEPPPGRVQRSLPHRQQ